jgi:CBS domain-containing protein
MNPNTPLAVVCDSEGTAVGVISRTDLVKVLADARIGACHMSAETIMSPSVFSCQPHQSLQEVWEGMNTRSLRCAPVLDNDGRPQGILHARDLAKALLEEVTTEEVLLRDYVMGVGYQ